VRDKEPVGFRAKAAEAEFLLVKGLCKEVESQLLLIQNLEQRVASISSDLDAEEQAHLDGDIKSLNSEYNTLCSLVKDYEQQLNRYYADPIYHKKLWSVSDNLSVYLF